MSDPTINSREQQASTLRAALKTLSPRPLVTESELAAFYSDGPNQVRGDDKIARIKLGLSVADGDNPYKVFLIGHSGSGKSTELSRLVKDTYTQYRYIRFDIREELDPVNFKPFDVLLLMMIRLAEQCAALPSEGGAGQQPSDKLLKRIWDWFDERTTTETLKRSASIGADSGTGSLENAAWWPKVIKLFGNIKGEIKLSADREEKIVNYRLSRIYELVELLNALVRECNTILYDKFKGEWVFIGESFDKPGIPRAQIENLFLSYSNIFQDLEAHLIFNIPLDLAYCEKGAQLPRLSDDPIAIPDTPVFHPDHTPHVEGRQALASVLDRRMAPTLFDENQQTRLIVASGGNIRQLFALTVKAASFAILRNAPEGRIGAPDVDRAINDRRWEFQGGLGTSASDEIPMTYEDKAKKLVQIYRQAPEAEIRDPQLNALLRAGAVQEFNGTWWFGIHPIVVDILSEQGHIERDADGRLPGGTE